MNFPFSFYTIHASERRSHIVHTYRGSRYKLHVGEVRINFLEYSTWSYPIMEKEHVQTLICHLAMIEVVEIP